MQLVKGVARVKPALCLPVLCMMVTLVFIPVAASGQSDDAKPPIGIIDFYGLRTISQAKVKQALQIKEGDAIPNSEQDFHKFQNDAEQRLQSVPGVAEARLNFVCCDANKTILYVGVQEKGAPALTFLTAPQGKVRLPDDIVKAGAAFVAAFVEAIQKRDFGDDGAEGYSLMHYPAVRAVQEQFPKLAAQHLSQLRDVLHNSADADQRALAAQVIAYGAERQAVAADLSEAIRDPDGEVRNNASRALWLMAAYGQKHPEAHLHIPAEPFVDMMNSIDWTDRNKSSLALFALTENRDPALLALLRQRALPSLVEMARWRAQGHAFPACAIVGRIANLPEDEIKKECWSGDREVVITAGLKAGATN
jgi:hypothetical protein